ncbi:GNAT family N-acetyltransferase [Thalassotalea sp. Y01]|uniref:GNAT family N-acetyltransferase n=1 Tax=Thalassotalea sp. Y01 TaxID=2729613 RepID=UPI00145F8558|nr:GNAT family N-acetyltransferase [Thalassotalea sp. Y01]NMP17720.1 GNAT family N-acetyltransferase [Thalassotalea sp. Y01]
MHITLAQQSHSSALANIVKSTFHLACPEDSDPALQSMYISKHLSESDFLKFINSDDCIVLVATKDTVVAGLAVIETECQEIAMLSKLYILPQFHGQGLAPKLVDEAINQSKTKGFKQLNLSVFSENLKAKAFYEKYGFKHVGECDFHMESEIHKDHLYELTL